MMKFAFRRLTTVLVFALLVLTGVAAPAGARAQDDSAPAANPAEEVFDKGAKAFVDKDYAAAIVHFRKAYRLEPNPMILYNLSLAYLHNGDLEEARATAREAAERGLPEKARPRNKARIAALTAALSARDVAEDVEADEPKKAQEVEADAVASKDTEAAGGKEMREPGRPVAPVNEPATLGALGWSGVGLMAAGAGALGYAVFLDRTLDEDIAEFEANPTAAQKQRLADQQAFGKVVLFSGVGLAAVGAGLFTYDLLDGPEQGAVQLQATPRRGGASVDLRFRY